jgi:transcriptional regulator
VASRPSGSGVAFERGRRVAGRDPLEQRLAGPDLQQRVAAPEALVEDEPRAGVGEVAVLVGAPERADELVVRQRLVDEPRAGGVDEDRARDAALERRTPNTIGSVAGLLDQLADTRASGWAADREELEDGLRCIAAPVADHTGAVVGAVGLSGPADRITATTARRLGRELKATAAEVSTALGARAA